MRVYVNGEAADIPEQSTVAELVAERQLNPKSIVVEHNLVILSREEWSQSVMSDEDKLEIVTFMGGG